MALAVPPGPKPEDLAEEAALRTALRDLATLDPNARDRAVDAFRRTLLRAQAHVRLVFEEHHVTGLDAARLLASLMDTLMASLVSHAGQAAPPPDPVCVVATGGYGRGVLAPFSDLDLLFLTAAAPDPQTERYVAYILYFLWDLGLRVGHATRSIAECQVFAASDVTVRTALIDARPIAGDASLYQRFQEVFWADLGADGATGFIAAKQAERAQRHHRYGESPYMVEPNIKEGRGGLRDLQTQGWLLAATLPDLFKPIAGSLPDTLTGSPAEGAPWPLLTPGELRHGRRAYAFLWTIRFHLHLVTGRAEERLTFDLQPVVGARMGYTRHRRQDGVERFMRHYFLIARDVVQLAAVLEPALVRVASGPPALAREPDPVLASAGLTLADGKLMPLADAGFEDHPAQMLRILLASRDRRLDLHPLAIRSFIRNDRQAARLRHDPPAAAMFLDLLCGTQADDGGSARTDGAVWLGFLNETGFLGRFLPDWGRIVGQMQFDTYHVFTVDEHTIEAIRVLNALESGHLLEVAPVASGLLAQVQSRRALYVAVLLHDIAKGRGGDHSELGAELALITGPALGLSAEETETVSWLILHHLLLSQTAFKRDIDDPKTIVDIADTIQSPERLRLLLVLTVCDMRAVSPKVWNGWKATLLRELYARVAEVLEGGLSVTARDQRVQRAKDAALSRVADWSEPERQRFLTLGYPSYWLSFDPETHARHGRILRDADARDAPLTIDLKVLPSRAVTEVTVYTADHAGLFSRIAGALAVANASIVDARIHTLTNGMALDIFWIQDAGGGAFDAPHRLARLSVLIEQSLSGRLRIADELARAAQSPVGRRMRAIHVPPRVVVDNVASASHTVIEINGRDRPGLLHDVTGAISEAGLQIASAHVATYGVRAVDVFYVKDVFGLKIENDRKLAALRDSLLAALARPETPPATPPAIPPTTPEAVPTASPTATPPPASPLRRLA